MSLRQLTGSEKSIVKEEFFDVFWSSKPLSPLICDAPYVSDDLPSTSPSASPQCLLSQFVIRTRYGEIPRVRCPVSATLASIVMNGHDRPLPAIHVMTGWNLENALRYCWFWYMNHSSPYIRRRSQLNGFSIIRSHGLLPQDIPRVFLRF